jgi:hypothetical protein
MEQLPDSVVLGILWLLLAWGRGSALQRMVDFVHLSVCCRRIYYLSRSPSLWALVDPGKVAMAVRTEVSLRFKPRLVAGLCACSQLTSCLSLSVVHSLSLPQKLGLLLACPNVTALDLVLSPAEYCDRELEQVITRRRPGLFRRVTAFPTVVKAVESLTGLKELRLEGLGRYGISTIQFQCATLRKLVVDPFGVLLPGMCASIARCTNLVELRVGQIDAVDVR